MKRLALAAAACGLLLSAAPAQAVDALEGLKLNGFLSAGYNYNFNEPHTGAVNLRPFNDTHDSMTVELAQLVFHKDAEAVGETGFRLDLNFGYTVPAAIHSTGAASSDDFDVRQAFVTWVAPVGSGLKLDFGKFVTDHGLEVIEGYEDWNWNYSRSFLFYNTIPFTHTGLRATYAVSDALTLSGAVVNGWDNVKDNNTSKSAHIHAAIAAPGGLGINLKYMVGAEQDDDNANLRHLFNANLSREFGKVALKADFVYATEEGVPGAGDSTWIGIAGYARYALSEKLALNARAEIFSDRDGARAELFGLPAGTAQDLWEVTLTPEYTVNDNLVIRAEWRHDKSDSQVFDKDSGLSDSQDTVGLNAIYHF